MGSPFEDADAELSAPVLEAFGEPATIRPRRGSQYGSPGADADRLPDQVEVIFSESPGLEWLSGSRRGSDLQGGTRVSVGDAEVWISKAGIDALGYTPAKGDLVSLRGRAFSVAAAPMVSDLGDMRLLLVREGTE